MHKVFRVSSLVAGIWLSIAATNAHASAADDAFNGLMSAASTSISGSGYLQTQTRGVLVGGSMRVYVPRQTVQLISISPPSFDAGCGGINLFTGGFSFINAAQFQVLIKNIMTNALGYAIELGIRTLCPMCADILNALQKLAQAANGMGIDSCNVAQKMVNAGFDFAFGSGSSSDGKGKDNAAPPETKGGTQAAQGACSTTSAATGGSSDFLDAMTSACNGLVNSMNRISDFLSSPPGGSTSDSMHEKFQGVVGNQLWMSLTEAGYSNSAVKEAIMAINGFSVTPPDGSSGTTPGKPIVVSGWGPGGAETMLIVLLFGNNPTNGFNTFKTSYGATVDPALLASMQAKVNSIVSQNLTSLTVPLCCANGTGSAVSSPPPSGCPQVPPTTSLSGSGASGVLGMCTSFYMQPLGSLTSSQNYLLAGNGLIYNVTNALSQAVKAVANNQPIPAEAIQIMQMTPLPVYQMVNIAAVYPQASAELIQRYSYFISVLIAESIVDNMIAPDVAQQGLSEVPASTITQTQNLVSAIGQQIKAAQGSIADALAVQESMMANLHSINQVMYQQMAASGLQGNLLFSQSLSTTGR